MNLSEKFWPRIAEKRALLPVSSSTLRLILFSPMTLLPLSLSESSGELG
jgi:hypothetical protein